jgi:hypothetical protein
MRIAHDRSTGRWTYDCGPAKMRSPQKPSQVKDRYWVEAVRSDAGGTDLPYSAVNIDGGKWLIFVPVAKLDRTWVLIAGETLAGRLGPSAKAATVKHNENSADPGVKVICVYTRDADDRADVMRVRARLFELGFTNKLPYKSNETTRAGLYAGAERVSKYYE